MSSQRERRRTPPPITIHQETKGAALAIAPDLKYSLANIGLAVTAATAMLQYPDTPTILHGPEDTFLRFRAIWILHQMYRDLWQAAYATGDQVAVFADEHHTVAYSQGTNHRLRHTAIGQGEDALRQLITEFAAESSKRFGIIRRGRADKIEDGLLLEAHNIFTNILETRVFPHYLPDEKTISQALQAETDAAWHILCLIPNILEANHPGTDTEVLLGRGVQHALRLNQTNLWPQLDRIHSLIQNTPQARVTVDGHVWYRPSSFLTPSINLFDTAFKLMYHPLPHLIAAEL